MKLRRLAFAAVLAVLATPLLAASAQPPPIYEWGQPVASGGPGATPTVTQTLATSSIDAGNAGDVAVLSDGTAVAWGGSPADGTMTAKPVPGVSDVIARPVDGNHSFDFLEGPGSDPACPGSTTVVKWANTKPPTVVTALNCKNVVQLAAGASHTIALTSSGDVYVWGGGNHGELGLGSGITSESNPTLNPAASALTGGTSTGVEITAGSVQGGLLINGQAYYWGANTQDQCGCNSSATYIWTPTAVAQGATRFTWIDQGGNFVDNGHTLAIATDGSIWAWGDNAEGQLGDGTTTNRGVPVLVQGLPAAISDVRAGGAFSMALDGGGNVWTWGADGSHELGDGGSTNRARPVEVLSGVSAISAGAMHALAQ